MHRRRVVIVGQGYVGLPFAMRAVDTGHDVVGYDVDSAKVKLLNAGESHVEDVPPHSVASARATGRYRATDDAADCTGFDTAVITVPTPLSEGVPDLSHIEASARALSVALVPGATIILESTTYPGTTEEFVIPILEAGSGLVAGSDFGVGYSPERIDPGNSAWNVVNTPKVISGIDDQSLASVDQFYRTLVEQTVPVTSCRVAELSKLLENTFRHVNIALINELAMFAHDLDINIWEAIDAAATKPFGYMRFTPGPGVGGHCLPIDPSYLSWRVKRSLGQNFRFVELANDVNDHMPEYVLQRLVIALNREQKPLNGSRILVLGLAYKRNTGDARESPALRVLQLLVGMGCDVRVVDPYVGSDQVPHQSVCAVALDRDQVARADAVLLLVDHDVFDLEMVSRSATFVLDTRHAMSGGNVEYL